MTIDPCILRGARASARRRTVPIAAPLGSSGILAPSPIAFPATGSGCADAPAPPLARLTAASDREAAAAEGYAAGYREGHAEASLHCEAQLHLARRSTNAEVDQLQRHLSEQAQREAQTIADLQRSIVRAIGQRLDELEPLAIELAFSALCKILGPDSERVELLSNLVRQAMSQLRSAEPVKIQLNPASLALIESRLADLQGHAACASVEWVADATLPPTGCVIVGNQGRLDAGLQTQVDSLRALWAATDQGARF